MANRTRSGKPAQGFTYVGLIIGMAVLGLVGASTLKLSALLQRRAAEHELLQVGLSYSRAFSSYAQASEAGQPRGPKTLTELLRDPRFASAQRHLRQLYADPITGQDRWGLILDADKVSIVGVYSLSDQQPIKLAHFPRGMERFERKTRFSDWKFTADLAQTASPQ